MKQIQIFSLRSGYAKKEELEHQEKRITEVYFTKKILVFLQDQVLVMKFQKKFWIFQKTNLRNFVR
mgnify:CR=1 FL=1